MRFHSVPRKTRDSDPDDGQPEIGIPFGLGIFPGLGNPHEIAGAGNDDEQVVAPENEPRPHTPGNARAAGALHDIEAGGEQHIAAEGEDDGGGMERPHTAEIRPAMVGKIEKARPGQLQRDDQADKESGDTPEDRGDDAIFDQRVLIAGLVKRVAPFQSARPERDDDQRADAKEKE